MDRHFAIGIVGGDGIVVMFEHLSNCHGEWNIVFTVMGSLPLVGAWIKFKFQKPLQNNDQDFSSSAR